MFGEYSREDLLEKIWNLIYIGLDNRIPLSDTVQLYHILRLKYMTNKPIVRQIEVDRALATDEKSTRTLTEIIINFSEKGIISKEQVKAISQELRNRRLYLEREKRMELLERKQNNTPIVSVKAQMTLIQ